MSAAGRVVRAYGRLLHLLPRSVREQDGAEMIAALAAMLESAHGPGERAGIVARSFGRLPLVAAAEWRDHLAVRRSGRSRGPGRADLGSVRRTVRVAARGLVRAPSFTWSAVLLVGLGVGAVTTVFTVMDHLFLRPLPYPEAERLIRVQNGSHSFPSLRDFQAIRSVEAWAASQTGDVNLTGEGEPVRLRQTRVTEGFFALFGARPSLGRLLVADDYGAADVVVLSHGSWQRLWGADPAVVGRTIRVDGEPVTVVGVLSPEFVAPEVMLDGEDADLWRPVDRSHPMMEDRGWHTLSVAGRLAPGATMEAASAEAAAVAEDRARLHPERYRRDAGPVPLPIVTLQEATVGQARLGFSLLLGAVTLLLLVACANVAHLFMARGLGRGREIALRRALGAGRFAIMGQLLAESLLIAAGGTLMGIALAAAGVRAFLLVMPEAIPRAASIAVDVRILAFAAGLAALTAIAFGLLPTLRVLGRETTDPLRAGGRTATGGRGLTAARTGLIIAEVALSVVLVSSAGLLLRSFARLHDRPLGFRTENVWTLPLRLADESDAVAWRGRMDRILDALARVPGVTAATYAESVPLEHTGGNRCCWTTSVRLPEAEDGPAATVHPIAGDYLDVFGQRIVAGRAWSDAEARSSPPPALVNEALAVALFGAADRALGRELRTSGRLHRVVGVLADDRHYGPDRDHGPAAWIPASSIPFVIRGHVAVRAGYAGADLPGRLRAAVWSVEPELPVPVIRSMEEWAAGATAWNRFDSALFSAFAALALLLAAGGLYGTLLYTVGTERREIGIRLALGASRRAVEARVLGRGLRTAAAGAVVGGVVAWGAGRILQSRLFEVEAGDPATLLAATTLLLATAAAASWLPARRAAATDPLETLREE